MSELTRFGKTPAEHAAEENETCRNIVKEIMNFGVTERQQLMIIYLLSMQLENAEHMQVLSSIIKEIGGQALFLSSQENNGGLDGKINV